jgi:hypothetical protein
MIYITVLSERYSLFIFKFQKKRSSEAFDGYLITSFEPYLVL